MYPNYNRHLPRSYIMGALIRRREDHDSGTEIVHEVGTTAMAIGDATAEIMLTTPGKIPNQMFELDETTINAATINEENRETGTAAQEKSTDSISEFSTHSTLWIVMIILLLILIFACCVTACVIARARRKQAEASDMECDIDCQGVRRPLISSDKMSDATSRSSVTSARH